MLLCSPFYTFSLWRLQNFKAQNIDTPGVINRVSSLFRGYNKLILGFNTFLPEGYKIELRDIEEMNRVHEAKLAAEAARRKGGGGGGSSGSGGSMGSGGHPPAPPPIMSPHIVSRANAMPGIGASVGMHGPMMHQPPRSGGKGPSAMMSRQMPSVLPKQGGGAMLRNESPQHYHDLGPPGMAGSMLGGHKERGAAQGASGVSMHPQHQMPGPAQLPSSTQPANTAEQPAEFDHAISYVTTIKKRFIGEPQTYKAFLEILHTYQKEQRGIKEVLEQVSTLFADHPDLLREFTYFLPDPVQDQARERLNRAAHESEMRKAKAAARFRESSMTGYDDAGQGGAQHHGHDGWGPMATTPSSGRPKSKSKSKKPMQGSSSYGYGDLGYGGPNHGAGGGGYPTVPPHPSGPIGFAKSRPGGSARKAEKLPTPSGGSASKAHSRAPVGKSGSGRMKGGKEGGSAAMALRHPERALFDALKSTLMSNGRESWQEFLKCVELYSIEILNRSELLSLVADLFGPHTDLLTEFKRLIDGVDDEGAGVVREVCVPPSPIIMLTLSFVFVVGFSATKDRHVVQHAPQRN
jgi:paired amphipathic helix protein Sin3a